MLFFVVSVSFRHEESIDYFAAVALLSIIQAASFILREYLSAQSRPALGILSAETFPFALTCAVIWLLTPLTVVQAVSVFAIATMLATLFQGCIVFRLLSTHLRTGPTAYRTRDWFRYGFFSLLGFGGRSILDRLDVIILGAFSLSASLASFNSSLRMTSLMLLVPVIMLPVFSPHISKAFEQGDMAQIRRDMFLQTALIAVAVLPIAALLFTFPAEITTTLFGEEYRSSGWLLGCLVFSQVMFAFSLPWSNFFLMTSGERVYGLTHIAALLLALVISIGQIHSMGPMAVAVGMTSANTVLFAVFFVVGAIRLTERDPQ